MIIYWSMLLWVPFIYLFYSAIRKRKETNVFVPASGTSKVITPPEKEKFPLSYAVLVFAYFTFWIGMRGYIADTTQYIMTFNSISSNFVTAWSEINWESKGPGFSVFTVFFKCFFSQDYQWWLMVNAIISIVPIMQILRKYSCDFFFSSFMFIASSIYFWPMNSMRQFICVAILFGCCKFIEEGKFFRFALVVLLLSTVHYTCLMMLLVYFVARSKPWQFKIFIFITVIALVCVFAEPIFAGLEDTVFSNTAYAGTTLFVEGDDGVNPLRAIFYFVFPVLAFIRRKELEKCYEDNPILPIAINMSLITATLYVVGVFTSGILIGRLPIYCELYNLILVPCIIKYGFNEKDRVFVRIGLVAMMVVMFALQCPSYYHSELTRTVY